MPSIVAIPERANTVSFTPATVREHADFLSRVEEGGAVAMDDTHKTENKARTRGKKMAEVIKTRYGITPRVHLVPEGPDDSRVFRPALSVKTEDVDTLTAALEAEDKAAAEAAEAAAKEAEDKAAAEAAEAAARPAPPRKR